MCKFYQIKSDEVKWRGYSDCVLGGLSNNAWYTGLKGCDVLMLGSLDRYSINESPSVGDFTFSPKPFFS